jgi:transposase
LQFDQKGSKIDEINTAIRPRKRGQKLNDTEKAQVIKGYRDGTSLRELATVLGKPKGQISNFFYKQKQVEGLPPREKKKNTMVTGRMGVVIKEIIRENNKLGVRAIPGKMRELLSGLPWFVYKTLTSRYPSKDTIWRFLKRNKYSKKGANLKAPLKQVHIIRRLEFAKKWLVEGRNMLGNVIWTDETRVASNPNGRKTMHWTTQKIQFIKEKMHSGGNSVTFWGCISRMGRGPLVALEAYMNKDRYIEILEQELLPELEAAKELFPGPWRLQQDNAPCHTAKAVKDYCAAYGVEFIEWPAYSPDLNPIENVWAWVKHNLDVYYPPCNSAEEIEKIVVKIWKEITPEMCHQFCGTYEKRLEAVIKAKGAHTKY